MTSPPRKHGFAARPAATSPADPESWIKAPEAQAQRALDIILRKVGLTEIEPDRNPIRFITITAESL